MPAEGKPALSAAEIKVIEVWITNGAKMKVADSALALSPATEQDKSCAASSARLPPATENNFGSGIVSRNTSRTALAKSDGRLDPEDDERSSKVHGHHFGRSLHPLQT